MRTAYKCRAYPDPEQAAVLSRTFGCVRVVWNRTLAWRHARYHGEHAGTSFAQANAYLTAMKAGEELEWLNEVSSVPLCKVQGGMVSQSLCRKEIGCRTPPRGASRWPTELIEVARGLCSHFGAG